MEEVENVQLGNKLNVQQKLSVKIFLYFYYIEKKTLIYN